MQGRGSGVDERGVGVGVGHVLEADSVAFRESLGEMGPWKHVRLPVGVWAGLLLPQLRDRGADGTRSVPTTL